MKNNYKRNKCLHNAYRLLLLFTWISASTGCATYIKGREQNVSIFTEPEGATILSDQKIIGITPDTMSLKKCNHCDSITLHLEGYFPITFEPTTRFDWISILNLYVFPGWLYDAATGAMWKYDPVTYTFVMAPDSTYQTEKFENNASIIEPEITFDIDTEITTQVKSDPLELSSNHNKFNLSVGYGFPNWLGLETVVNWEIIIPRITFLYNPFESFQNYETNVFGPIKTGFEYRGLSNKYSFGGSITYASRNFYFDYNNQSGSGTNELYNYHIKLNSIGVNFLAKRHYLTDVEQIDIYGVTGIGVKFRTAEMKTLDPIPLEYEFDEFKINLILGYGITYFFTDFLGLYIEVGGTNLFSSGLVFRFEQ